MKDPKEFLEKDRLLHIDMIDALLDKKTEVLYSEEDGVLFRRDGWLYELSAETPEATEKIAALMEKGRDIVAHQFKFIPNIFNIASGYFSLILLKTFKPFSTPFIFNV